MESKRARVEGSSSTSTSTAYTSSTTATTSHINCQRCIQRHRRYHTMTTTSTSTDTTSTNSASIYSHPSTSTTCTQTETLALLPFRIRERREHRHSHGRRIRIPHTFSQSPLSRPQSFSSFPITKSQQSQTTSPPPAQAYINFLQEIEPHLHQVSSTSFAPIRPGLPSGYTGTYTCNITVSAFTRAPTRTQPSRYTYTQTQPFDATITTSYAHTPDLIPTELQFTFTESYVPCSTISLSTQTD